MPPICTAVKKEDLEGLWGIFRRFDLKREGQITKETFFKRIIKEDRNDFGDAIFYLIDAENEEEGVEFGEFVQAVCTFCCLSASEMLKFSFLVYDKDRSGHLETEELHQFIKVRSK
ncbi:unnamed protein product [Choristocarpus tenellus]